MTKLLVWALVLGLLAATWGVNLGSVSVMSTTTPGLQVMLLVFGTVYIGLLVYLLVRYVAMNSKKRYLSELFKECKIATKDLNNEEVTIHNRYGHSVTVRGNEDAGTFAITLSSNGRRSGAMFILTPTFFGVYNGYATDLKVGAQTIVDITAALKAHSKTIHGMFGIVEHVEGARTKTLAALTREEDDTYVSEAIDNLPKVVG